MYEQNEILDRNKAIQDAIKTKATPEGRLHVYLWGRDCDCVETDEIREIDATFDAYMELESSVYASAEGPVVIKIVSADEAKDFCPSERDLIMEGRENGEHFHLSSHGARM